MDNTELKKKFLPKSNIPGIEKVWPKSIYSNLINFQFISKDLKIVTQVRQLVFSRFKSQILWFKEETFVEPLLFWFHEQTRICPNPLAEYCICTKTHTETVKLLKRISIFVQDRCLLHCASAITTFNNFSTTQHWETSWNTVYNRCLLLLVCRSTFYNRLKT